MKTSNINMTKQFRAEVRALKRNRRIVLKDFSEELKNARKDIAYATREINRLNRAEAKEMAKIDRRIAILNGRLS